MVKQNNYAIIKSVFDKEGFHYQEKFDKNRNKFIVFKKDPVMIIVKIRDDLIILKMTMLRKSSIKDKNKLLSIINDINAKELFSKITLSQNDTICLDYQTIVDEGKLVGEDFFGAMKYLYSTVEEYYPVLMGTTKQANKNPLARNYKKSQNSLHKSNSAITPKMKKERAHSAEARNSVEKEENQTRVTNISNSQNNFNSNQKDSFLLIYQNIKNARKGNVESRTKVQNYMLSYIEEFSKNYLPDVPEDKKMSSIMRIVRVKWEDITDLEELIQLWIVAWEIGAAEMSSSEETQKKAAFYSFVTAEKIINSVLKKYNGKLPDEIIQYIQKRSSWGQLCLADCYYDGIGTPRDIEKAKEYYTQSAQNGNQIAQDILKNNSFDDTIKNLIINTNTEQNKQLHENQNKRDNIQLDVHKKQKVVKDWKGIITELERKYPFDGYVYYNNGHDKNSRKIDLARKYFANMSGEETPIFCYDDTLFGSVKDGFLVSDKGVYIHNYDDVTKVRFFSWDEIKDIRLEKRKKLYVNDKLVEVKSIGDKKERQKIYEVLMAIRAEVSKED